MEIKYCATAEVRYQKIIDRLNREEELKKERKRKKKAEKKARKLAKQNKTEE